MYVVIVKFTVKPEEASSFKSLVLEQADNSLKKEQGCHTFDVIQDESDLSIFYLYEIYTTSNAFHEHLKTTHFVEFDRITTDKVLAKQVFLGEHITKK